MTWLKLPIFDCAPNAKTRFTTHASFANIRVSLTNIASQTADLDITGAIIEK